MNVMGVLNIYELMNNSIDVCEVVGDIGSACRVSDNIYSILLVHDEVSKEIIKK